MRINTRILAMLLPPFLTGAAPSEPQQPEIPMTFFQMQSAPERARALNIARAICFGDMLEYQQFITPRQEIASTDPVIIRRENNRKLREFYQRVREDREQCPVKKTEPFLYDIGYQVSIIGPGYTWYFIAMKQPEEWTYFTITYSLPSGPRILGWKVTKGPPRPELKPYRGD